MLVVRCHRLLFSSPSAPHRSATLVVAHQELPPVGIPSYAVLIQDALGEPSLKVVFTHGTVSFPLTPKQYDDLAVLPSLRLKIIDPLDDHPEEDHQSLNVFTDDVSSPSGDGVSGDGIGGEVMQVLMDMTISLSQSS